MPVTKTFPQSARDALSSMYATELGESMKRMEDCFDLSVESTTPFIVRIDGCSFHTFTKGLHSPMDTRLTRCMVKTTIDCVEKFNAVTGYHQSDEISLVFPAANDLSDPAVAAALAASLAEKEVSEPPQKKKKQKKTVLKNHPYNGRVQKMATVVASFASVRLNFHLMNENWDNLDAAVAKRMKDHVAYFDGRVVACTSTRHVTDCIFWRSNFDGFRNSVSHIAQHYFSGKQLHGKSVYTQYEMVRDQMGVELFDEYGTDLIYGSWIKKERYQMEAPVNPVTGKIIETPVFRSRYVVGSFNFADFTMEQRINLIMAKLVNDISVEDQALWDMKAYSR